MSRAISITLSPPNEIGLQRPLEPDVHVNFQRLRHTQAARWARRLVYRALCGPGWPMRFLPPAPGWRGGAAPHLYVHLPFCRSICLHCPYVKFRYAEDRHAAYRDALLREMDACLTTDPHRPALVLQTTDGFRRAHWLYWKLYGLAVDPREYRAAFGRSLGHDFGWVLWAFAAAGMARRRDGVWRVTPFGATWMHRLQQLFSLTYIDDMWSRCRDEAWPREVVLA